MSPDEKEPDSVTVPELARRLGEGWEVKTVRRRLQEIFERGGISKEQFADDRGVLRIPNEAVSLLIPWLRSQLTLDSFVGSGSDLAIESVLKLFEELAPLMGHDPEWAKLFRATYEKGQLIAKTAQKLTATIPDLDLLSRLQPPLDELLEVLRSGVLEP